MKSLTFKYAILYVKDVTDTLKFFEAVFGFKRAMLHESGDCGELDTGSTILSFSSLELTPSSFATCVTELTSVARHLRASCTEHFMFV